MKVEEAVDIMAALANPARLRIFAILIQRELCVCEIEKALGIEQSRISHALRTLKQAGLIGCRTDGKWKIYSLKKGISGNALIKGLGRELSVPKKDIKGLKCCIEEGVRKSCRK